MDKTIDLRDKRRYTCTGWSHYLRQTRVTGDFPLEVGELGPER